MTILFSGKNQIWYDSLPANLNHLELKHEPFFHLPFKNVRYLQK